jgi:hypothetical protein
MDTFLLCTLYLCGNSLIFLDCQQKYVVTGLIFFRMPSKMKMSHINESFGLCTFSDRTDPLSHTPNSTSITMPTPSIKSVRLLLPRSSPYTIWMASITQLISSASIGVTSRFGATLNHLSSFLMTQQGCCRNYGFYQCSPVKNTVTLCYLSVINLTMGHTNYLFVKQINGSRKPLC